MKTHLKPDKVATATERAFIIGCCESIEDIPDTAMSMKRYASVVAPVVLPALQEPFPCIILLMSKFSLKWKLH